MPVALIKAVFLTCTRQCVHTLYESVKDFYYRIDDVNWLTVNCI